MYTISHSFVTRFSSNIGSVLSNYTKRETNAFFSIDSVKMEIQNLQSRRILPNGEGVIAR